MGALGPLPQPNALWTEKERPSSAFAQYMLLLDAAVRGGFTAPAPTRAGDLIYWNGSAWVSLAGNNSGTKILQEDASGNPSWVAPSNTVQLLNTLTASSSATLSDTTSLTASFRYYDIVFESLVPLTDLVDCEFQVHSGGTFQSGAGAYTLSVPTFRAVAAFNVTANTFLPLCESASLRSGSPIGLSGTVRIYNPSQATSPKWIIGQTAYSELATNVNPATSLVSGFWNGGNGAVDGFQVSMSAGNFNGTIRVYGIT